MTTLAAKVDWVTITLPDVNGMKRTRDMPRDQAISILRHAAELQDTIEGIGEDGLPMTVHQAAYSPEDIAAMSAQADALESDAQ